jgi:hypothetical protein
MSDPHQKGQPSTQNQFKRFSVGLSVVGTVFGFIAAIGSDAAWIRLLAIVVILAGGFIFLYLVRFWIRSKMALLPWRPLTILVIGIVVGAVASPFIFQPTLSSLLTSVAPHVTLVESIPKNGGTIDNGEITSKVIPGIVILLSKPVAWPYYMFTKVEISPDHPIDVSWEGFHQALLISANEPHSIHGRGASNIPRCEHGTSYNVTVSGPFLAEPITVNFHTPELQ